MNTKIVNEVIAMKMKAISIFLIIVAGIIAIPVMAADQYLGGSPDLTATVTGINEFSPGQDGSLTVLIQNTGTNDARFVDHSTISPDDLPTTAILAKVGLSSGMAPLLIKTDTQDIGDLLSPSITSVSFRIKVTPDATSGEYQLPLMVQYKYLSNSISNQPSSDTVAPEYSDRTAVIPVTIKIKPAVKISVVNVATNNLIVGTEGYLNLTIENQGSGDGKEASVILLRDSGSPIIPSDSSVYIGDFNQGQTVTCLYKVSVSNDAKEEQASPVDVQVTYTNSEGKIVNSAVETVGVPVGTKLGFAITSTSATLQPGGSGIMEVEYQNTGSVTAHQALARITVVEPFDSNDDMAYLGDVAPGQTVVGKYTISADSNAIPATYQLDTNVRYRDAFDNSLISDTVTAPVKIIPSKQGFPLIPFLGALGVLCIIGVCVCAYIRKTKR